VKTLEKTRMDAPVAASATAPGAGAAAAPIIALDGVAKAAGGRPVIARADLAVAGGRGLCLAGPSGCGKTTLLEVAAGLSRPDAGSVRLGGSRPGCMFQDDVLLPWLDCRDNVAYVLHGPLAARREQARPWLERLGLPLRALPTALSGGMRRRLNLARALAVRPDILFLDEPFAFLDAAWTAAVGTLLAAALDTGAAILMTSHQTPDTLDPRIAVVHVGGAPGPLVLEAPPQARPTASGPAKAPGGGSGEGASRCAGQRP
jgi:ABC-type nitrate/sulfonate/bicarbonate transport system ATPase subunit